MDWLEITITTAPTGIEEVAASLTAAGFDDLLLEDQEELEAFLEQNRAYWDYIDESLQEKLRGVSRIKLYLQEDDIKALSRLKELVGKLKEKDAKNMLGSLELAAEPLPQIDWEESWGG